jgi:putative tryptophan/tyrosine transport system substrate-binding protein
MSQALLSCLHGWGHKNLEMLHELAPDATVIGVLVNPNNPNAEPQLRDLQASAPMLGLRLIPLAAGTVREIESIFATLGERQPAKKHCG